MTPEDFQKRIGTAAVRMEKGWRDQIKRQAERTAQAAQASILAATGGDGRFSGGGRHGKNYDGQPSKVIKVASSPLGPERYRVGPRGRGTAGLLAILESGSNPHVIGAGKNTNLASRRDGTLVRVRKNKKTGKVTSTAVKRRPVLTPWGYKTGPFFVRGVPARHVFTRAVNRIAPEIAPAVAKSVHKQIVTSLRGS